MLLLDIVGWVDTMKLNVVERRQPDAAKKFDFIVTGCK